MNLGDASISGIRTSITRHDVTAHDVSNVNTPGYEERQVHQAEKKPRGVSISHISKTPNQQADFSNTDLAVEAGEQMINKTTLKANASALKVKNEMLGEVIDLVG